MKLRSIAVKQFKKFTAPKGIQGMVDGLNVVVGPNELGKSTLLDAIRAALFEKHNSRAQPIVALQNDRNKAAPVVELEFELDDGLYCIRKRFVKQPHARLSCPDGRLLEGDEAEAKLRELLGFDEPGTHGVKPETLGMWGVLWVQQGRSFETFDIPESARSNLHSALESEVGDVLGGRRGRVLPQTIERQLREFVTEKTKKPTGAYKESIENLETINKELEALNARRQNLTAALDELETAQSTLTRISDGERDRIDQQELDEARKRHRQLAELESEITTANTELQLKQQQLTQTLQIVTQREQLRGNIEEERASVQEAEENLAEVQERLGTVKSQVDALRAAVRKSEAELTNATKKESRHRRVLTSVERQSQLKELEDRLKKAKAAELRKTKAKEAAAAILVVDKVLAKARKASRELESIESRLDASATTISFEMPPEVLTEITIAGQGLVNSETSIRAVEPTTISIPDRGSITVEPAIKDRDQLIEERRKGRVSLAKILENAGVRSLSHAEEENTKLKTLKRDADFANEEVELHAAATEDHEGGVLALGAFIEGLKHVLNREKEELDLKDLPVRAEAETDLQAAQRRTKDAHLNQERARASLTGPQGNLDELQVDINRRQSTFDERNSRLDLLQSQLDSAEEDQPDDDLSVLVSAANSAVTTQKGVVENLEAKRSDETLPQLQARINRLDQSLSERQVKRTNLNVTIAGLKSKIEVEHGAGIDESIEKKKRELAIAEEEKQRKDHEVNVLTLLLSVLRKAEQEAKERYLSPVLKRVQPYLQHLFPGSEIVIDENLHVTGVIRQEGYEEMFSHLSMGTQEQIAVLVRLAFAEMLAQQHRPVTVILDDALVFSDDQRMSRIFDILNTTANQVQVIVFTCREQLFEGLGGQQLNLVDADSDELISA